MRQRLHLSSGVLAALFVVALAGARRRADGPRRRHRQGRGRQPIKGATVTAENPDASPSSFTATTDDKGRFSIIGLQDRRVDVHGAGAGLRARVRAS